MRLRPLAVVGVLLCGGEAVGQEAPTGEPPSSPEACVGIVSDSDRLACYDRAFGRDQLPGSAVETPPEAAASPDSQAAGAPARPAFGLFDGPATPGDTPVAASLLDSRWELSKNAKLGSFTVRAHRPVWLLPAVWTDSPNRRPSSPAPNHTVEEDEILDDTEVAFQLSLKTKAWQGVLGSPADLWLGYTQSSRWQLYNSATSRPFRETNYEPEALLVLPVRFHLGGVSGRMLAVGVNHQSNGRSEPRSRSWNRLLLMVGMERDNWTLMLRPWVRLDEPTDDNPDIEDFLGRADLQIVGRLAGHELALMARHSLRSGERSRGALELTWTFPMRGALVGYVRVFDGYGESLIDYNARQTWLGLGLSLVKWY